MRSILRSNLTFTKIPQNVNKISFWGVWNFWFFIMADTNFLFLLTFRKPETQTLGGSVIGSFALGHIFGELEPFLWFLIVVNTNFLFLSTLRKPNFRKVSNWEFCSRTCFWGTRVIFPIFHNGWYQFSISIDTQKTGDPNFRGVGNWEFCSRTHFWEARAIFLIAHNGQHQFSISFTTQKTGDPNFREGQ